MKILIASDHAGVEIKSKLVQWLKSMNHEVIDYGPNSTESVDYPDFADKVCQNLNASQEDSNLHEFGILICGSGQGMALRANKYPKIRAALVYSSEIATLAREHNNANVICIGSRFCNLNQAKEWINLFKSTLFLMGRHQSRVAKVSAPIA